MANLEAALNVYPNYFLRIFFMLLKLLCQERKALGLKAIYIQQCS